MTPRFVTARRVRNGRLPPILSTAAPKGMRRSEPVSAGIAARMPAANGERPRMSVNFGTSGPKMETPAKPPKKPKVASHMACLRVPRTRSAAFGGTEVGTGASSGVGEGEWPVTFVVLMVGSVRRRGGLRWGFHRRYVFYMKCG